MDRRTGPTADEPAPDAGPKSSAALMYAAASLYYLQDATQAEIARRLRTSRPTVSRLLSEARRRGIVRIEVVAPADADEQDLADRAARALDLHAVHVSPAIHPPLGGTLLAPGLFTALDLAGIVPGDVLLVSSGRTVYEVAQGDLPRLPGVLLAPTIGGQDEPESWYQPNEITRQLAAKVGGAPSFIFAPAMPSASLFASLMDDADTRRVFQMWRLARCVVLGVGGPPHTRQSLPRFISDTSSLRAAVGDVCSRFYDSEGHAVAFPGSDRLIALGLADLRRIPIRIAVAYGEIKVPGLLAGARAGYYNQLVTDVPTAAALLSAAESGRAAS